MGRIKRTLGRIVFICVLLAVFYLSGVMVRSRLGTQVRVVNRSGDNLQSLSLEVVGSGQNATIQLSSLSAEHNKRTYVRPLGAKAQLLLRFDDSKGNHHEGVAVGYLSFEDCSDVTVTVLPDFSLQTEESRNSRSIGGVGSASCSCWLPPNQPHRPARHQHSTHEQGKAVEAVVNHLASGVALRDTEDNRCEDRENNGGAEVREFDRHYFR
jgi:hypothetical protein